jgi:galactokinase
MQSPPDIDSLAALAAAGHRAMTGRDPDGCWAAPGRVNVIGEHTDYSDGLCLPMAIDLGVVAAASRREDGVLRMRSLDGEGTVELTAADLRRASGWAAYPAGVAWALREAGHAIGGADLVFASSVPAGAGLSSSAALECATGRALADLHGVAVDPIALARAAQRGENEVAGVPCGIMDQLASTAGRAGCALLLDVRALSVTPIPFDLPADGLALVVVDTRTRHQHAGGEYAARRAACETAAAQLGVAALRDVAFADLDRALARLADPVLVRRARHVVTEIERVRRAVAALAAGRPAALGPLLTASHASLRDDFEVSSAELDLGVEAALAAGALGARMMGGGFGGSLLALVVKGGVDALERAVAGAFERAGLGPPGFFRAVPSAGARALG